MILIKIDCSGHSQMLCGLSVWSLLVAMWAKGLSNSTYILICTIYSSKIKKKKVPKIWKGTPYLFTFADRNYVFLPYTLYMGQLPPNNTYLAATYHSSGVINRTLCVTPTPVSRDTKVGNIVAVCAECHLVCRL